MVKGTWTVPRSPPAVPTHTYSSIWVGIDVLLDNTVEQTGTEQDWTSDGGLLRVVRDVPQIGYRILNFRPAGDTISAEVNYIGNNRFKLPSPT